MGNPDNLVTLLLVGATLTLEWTKLSSPSFSGRRELTLAMLNGVLYMAGGKKSRMFGQVQLAVIGHRKHGAQRLEILIIIS